MPLVKLSRLGAVLASSRGEWTLLSEPDPSDPMDMYLEELGDLPENPESRVRLKPVRTGGLGLRRVDATAQRTVQTNWDEEYANAQLHAQAVLKNVGNGRW